MALFIHSTKQESTFESNGNNNNNLYEVNIDRNNIITFEKLDECEQANLLDTEVFVLEVNNEMYIWLGKEAELSKRKSIFSIAKAFLGDSNGIQDVIPVKQGMEPPQFVNAFATWDPDMWMKINQYEEEREKVLRGNEIENFI